MRPSIARSALLAGITGTALQWYDFALFGYFAPIIAATYFPTNNPLAALLSTFGIFAVGYLLAPLGSLFFGYVGDSLGRKRALTLSILAMAIPTAIISIVPGYQYIGITAPILITLLRVIQGLVASSEFTGSAVFLVEHAPNKNKALYGCLTSSAYSVGLTMAGLAASFFTASFMPAWGWRLGFALALLAGILIFYLRTSVQETLAFQLKEAKVKSTLPFISAVKQSPHAVIGVIGLAWLVGVITFGTYVFTATYLHSYFHIPLSIATLIITLSLALDALLEPLFAIWADKIGFVPVIKLGLIITLFLCIPIFYLLATGNLWLITLGMMLMSSLIALTFAPLNAYMALLFPPQYRYSGFGVSFHIGISLFGGTAPLIMMWLVDKTGSFLAPAWYYLVAVIIGFTSLLVCEYGKQEQIQQEKTIFFIDNA